MCIGLGRVPVCFCHHAPGLGLVYEVSSSVWSPRVWAPLVPRRGSVLAGVFGTGRCSPVPGMTVLHPLSPSQAGQDMSSSPDIGGKVSGSLSWAWIPPRALTPLSGLRGYGCGHRWERDPPECPL